VEGLVLVLVREDVQKPKPVILRPVPVLVGLNFDDETAGVAREAPERCPSGPASKNVRGS
jgi:hypothetical protein